MIMKKILTIINILLVTLAVFAGVKVFYKLTTAGLDTSRLSTSDIGPSAVSEAIPVRPLSDYQAIAARNLFNTQTEKSQKAEMVDIEALKPTELNLKLLGTVAGDKDQAYAVIQDAKDRSENLYRIGDTVQSATVKLILREKVVLRVDDKNEILEIEKGQDSGPTRRTASKPPSNFSQNVTLDRSKIENAVQDINNLMRQARVRPHFTGGKPDGLSITGIRANSIFHNMGLKSGDIITSVDGRDIKSVDDALNLYQSLKTASNVKVQLKRRGRLKTIDYDIK